MGIARDSGGYDLCLYRPCDESLPIHLAILSRLSGYYAEHAAAYIYLYGWLRNDSECEYDADRRHEYGGAGRCIAVVCDGAFALCFASGYESGHGSVDVSGDGNFAVGL